MGLQVREAQTEEDLAGWYELYLRTMRQNAVPPRSHRFFQRLWCSLRPTGGMRLLVVEQRDRKGVRMVAGSILLKFGQTVFYAFTGCAPKDLCLHPHDILQIEAIRDACGNGYRWYDFSEVSEDHESLAQFKGKWGAKPKRLYRYYYPAAVLNESRCSTMGSSIRRQLWRLLPLKATVIAGDWIYSRL
jgi:CelD/BcsL family acetyltransferase involved in cellulose biosynthesis